MEPLRRAAEWHRRESGSLSWARVVGTSLMLLALVPFGVWAWAAVEHAGHGHGAPIGWDEVLPMAGAPFGVGFAVAIGRGRELVDAGLDRLSGGSDDE